MNPDWLEKLLRVLETADGSVPMDRPNVIPQARTVGPAQRGNIPVPNEILRALPAKRVSKADKVIGAASDLSPVGGVESLVRAFHLGRGGDQAGATRELLNAELSLAPFLKGGSIVPTRATIAEGAANDALDAARKGEYWHDAHLPTAAADSASARGARELAQLTAESDAATSRFRQTAADIRAFPEQRRQELINALRTPTTYAKGNPDVQNIMAQMQRASGSPNLPRVTSIDPEKGKLLAQAYEQLPVNDAKAKPAYDALNREVAAQKAALEKAGFKFEFVDEDPYKTSKEMMADVAQNKRLKVLKTNADSDHPYMTREQNDAFRGVHDLLAHAGEGHQFGPVGEENAYRVHASTLSPEALPALASETRGQNSWVNFGPNAHLPVRERPFAQQKAALFPSHLTGDYGDMAPQLPDKYAILTGENPFGRPATPERNAQHNLALEKALAQQGLSFQKVKGAYTDDATGNLLTENSYLIPNVDPHIAERIGRQHGQNGVVTHLGYHDLAGGTLHPSSGLSFAEDSPYTELPDGRRIRSEIDWSRNNPLADAGSAMADSVATRAPAVIVNNDWKPTSRGVFPRDPGSGLYREPAPLPYTSRAKPVMGTPKRADVEAATARALEMAQRISQDPRVEDRIVSDFNKGRKLGGMTWYGLKELRDFIESEGGPFDFKAFNAAGAAGSARTPTHNELTNMSLNLFGHKRGLTAPETKELFMQEYPNVMRPTYMKNSHRTPFDRAMNNGGILAPENDLSSNLKTPDYAHNRNLGAVGVPLDAHERTMMAQALGITRDEIDDMIEKGGAPAYEHIRGMYTRIADQMGVHPDQLQAGRWLGGGLQTGLESQPEGDFLQTLEDGLLYTQRTMGKTDESPKALRSLFGKIVRGDAFFMPYSGSGGFPVY